RSPPNGTRRSPCPSIRSPLFSASSASGLPPSMVTADNRSSIVGPPASAAGRWIAGANASSTMMTTPTSARKVSAMVAGKSGKSSSVASNSSIMADAIDEVLRLGGHLPLALFEQRQQQGGNKRAEQAKQRRLKLHGQPKEAGADVDITAGAWPQTRRQA